MRKTKNLESKKLTKRRKSRRTAPPLKKLRRKYRKIGKPFRELDGQYYSPFLKYKFKKRDCKPVIVTGDRLSNSRIKDGGIPFRLVLTRGKISVLQKPSSFKSAWYKNVRMLGGTLFGTVRNRELWKLASMITRYGLSEKNFNRVHQAYKLLSIGKHLGFSRIVSQLTGGSSDPRSSSVHLALMK